MRACGKIFLINLYNLQMLFMLRIKNKFSECLAPLHKHEGPNGRLSGDGSTQARRHGGAFGVSYPQIFFVPPKFCFAQKYLFQAFVVIKIKIFPPIKMYSPQTLKPGYRPGSAKIVSAIRIFCFEVHSTSRCSIT